jgi:UDPglucose--hexose-1-phosphate uridylyltransferase
VVAPGRGLRPGAAAPDAPEAGESADCPFCENHETETPPETFAVAERERKPDTPGWQVRVVPNLYPLFVERAAAAHTEPPFEAGPAHGRHEVVVHTPRHVVSIADLASAELEAVATAWRLRADSARDAGFAAMLAFVNEGRAAGASRPHTHSQLVAFAKPPPALTTTNGGGCRLCELLALERTTDRLVLEQDGLVCVCPFASRAPYELLVAPLACESDGFAGERLGAALMLAAEGVRRLHGVAGRVPLNAWLLSAPFGQEAPHWRLVVLPRLTIAAGLELAAGLGVNTVPPEEAAAALRAAG